MRKRQRSLLIKQEYITTCLKLVLLPEGIFHTLNFRVSETPTLRRPTHKIFVHLLTTADRQLDSI